MSFLRISVVNKARGRSGEQREVLSGALSAAHARTDVESIGMSTRELTGFIR